MTLQEILDAVLIESGLATESVYATATNDAAKRLLYLANRSIETLSRYPWQALRKTHEIGVTTATQYALPDDYRAFIPDTMYTDQHLWAVDFPANESEWAYLQASDGGSGEAVKVRIIGNTLNVYEPEDGTTIRVEYICNTPVLNGTTYKQRFTADDDTTLLDDDLVTRDILWRYKKLVGLPLWEADLAETKSLQRTLWGQDAGAQTIRPSGSQSSGPYYDLWRPSSEAV